MTWLFILVVLLLIFGWLLLTPIYVYISTSEARYEAGLKGIFKAKLSSGDRGIPEIIIRVLFIRFRFPIFSVKGKKIRAETKKKRNRKIRKLAWKRIGLIIKITRQIIRSFKLRQLILNIDTGDVIGNAYLIPAFAIIRRDRVRLSVNYEENNEFLIHFENKLGTMIIHTLITYFKHTYKK